VVRFPGKARDRFSSAVSRPELGTINILIQWVTYMGSFSGGKAAELWSSVHILPKRGVCKPTTVLYDVS
jgi:hypothetical protein